MLGNFREQAVQSGFWFTSNLSCPSWQHVDSKALLVCWIFISVATAVFATPVESELLELGIFKPKNWWV